MATKLRDIIRVAGAPPGVSTVAHGLNVDGTGVVPDKIELATGGSFAVTADDTNLTLTNLGGIGEDVDIYVEHFHSVDRVFDVGDEEMTPQPFIQSGGLISPDGDHYVKFADSGARIDVYVDGVNGDDENDGLTEATALATIQAVYRKFPMYPYQGSRLRVYLAGTGGFGASATAPLEYEIPVLLVNGQGLPYGTSMQYLGPEMVPVTPTTGPATAALDTPPAVAVAGGSPSAGGTLSTRFDFTGAAPGWTVNDFQGKFLRITRGGEKVVYEMPIAKNDADTITVRVTGVAPLINNTDTAEIVEPAVQFTAPASYGYYVAIVGDSTTATTQDYFGLGPNIVRCSFTGGIWASHFSCNFDRCVLGTLSGFGVYLDDCWATFFNCTAEYFYASGICVSSSGFVYPLKTSGTDPLTEERGINLQICGAVGWFEVSSYSRRSTFYVDLGLGVDTEYTEAIWLDLGAQLVCSGTARWGGWQVAAIQGECGGGAAGHLFMVQRGAQCYLGSNVSTAGVTSVYCTGGGDPLNLADYGGLSADYGNGVGEWEEAAGYAGVLYNPPAAGAAGDPSAVIRTY